LLERTHALRLQFEHEKGMWMAKIRQDTTDAYIEEQRIHQESFPSEFRSTALLQSESIDRPVDTSEGGKFSRCSPRKDVRDDPNRFIYDTFENDHAEFMDYDSIEGAISINEEANLGHSRKRKFSTPSRQAVCKAIVTPNLLNADTEAVNCGDEFEGGSRRTGGLVVMVDGNDDTGFHNTI
jgi:hypothetical protein